MKLKFGSGSGCEDCNSESSAAREIGKKHDCVDHGMINYLDL